MAKTATIRACAEPDLTAEAEVALAELGLAPTRPIVLYDGEILRERGDSFPLRRPAAASAR